MLHTNSILDVQEMSKRLYEIQRTIDVNVIQQKTPKIITCTENQRLVMKIYMHSIWVMNHSFSVIRIWI